MKLTILFIATIIIAAKAAIIKPNIRAYFLPKLSLTYIKINKPIILPKYGKHYAKVDIHSLLQYNSNSFVSESKY